MLSWARCWVSLIPVTPPPGITPLCLGDFDFLPGSTHTIGAAVPQMDRNGVYWVFSKFSNGLANGGVFKVLAKDKVRGKEVSMELVESPRLVLASPFGRCQGPPRIG